MTETNTESALITTTARISEIQAPIIPFEGNLIRDNFSTIILAKGLSVTPHQPHHDLIRGSLVQT